MSGKKGFAGRFELHVEEKGEGEAGLLYVHGIPGSSRDFEKLDQAIELAGRLDLRRICFDLPGQGKSPPTRFQHDAHIGDRAKVLQALLKKAGIKKAIVVAHSYGGGLALCAAHRWPAQIRGLVLINSIGTLPHAALPLPMPILRRIPRALENPLTGPAMAARMHRELRKMGLTRDPEPNLDRLRDHAGWVGALDFSRIHLAARALKIPVMIFSAADDRLVQGNVTDALIRALGPDVTLHHHRFSSGGHGLAQTRPAELAERMADVFENF
jgi:pimeloyl-ACP methyl ester carboxylesterase